VIRAVCSARPVFRNILSSLDFDSAASLPWHVNGLRLDEVFFICLSFCECELRQSLLSK
jgi:hypothetical protein